jgi:HlyD family secretion protein
VSRGKIIAGVVVLAIIGAIVAGVVYSSASSAPSVTTAKATSETLGVVVTASGKLEGARRADVYAAAAGTLASVKVKDGQAVKAGDTLAVMDTAPLKAQVKQAESALTAALAQQEAVNNGVPSAIDKSAAQAGLDAARGSYNAAKKAYEDFLELYNAADAATKATMVAQLNQLRATRDQAYAAVQNARSGVSKLSAASRMSAAKASAAKAVEAARSGLAVANATLADSKLTAPINGVVVFNALGTPGSDGSYPKADEGAAVTPGSSIFTVIDLSDLNFNAQVDEADIAKVQNGMTASVSLDAFPDITFEGTVSSVKPTAIQTTTGGIAFPVLIKVDAADKRLFVGMSGSADVEVEAVAGALVVPIESVLDENGKKFVYVLGSDSKVKKTEVVVGAMTDTLAEITSGVAEGETVVTSQLTALKDGQTVKVK